MTCHVCGNDRITHYKQRRVDGVWVVTARCANGHIPEKGRPFYPISQFDIASLPVLGVKDEQPELFHTPRTTSLPSDLMEYVEQKRNWRLSK